MMSEFALGVLVGVIYSFGGSALVLLLLLRVAARRTSPAEQSEIG